MALFLIPKSIQFVAMAQQFTASFILILSVHQHSNFLVNMCMPDMFLVFTDFVDMLFVKSGCEWACPYVPSLVVNALVGIEECCTILLLLPSPNGT